jgi:beta-galactosidase
MIFPGRGTALVGVLDPFWESKGYVAPEEYRRFCDATVPLARLAKRVFTQDEALEVEVEVAHYGPSPLRQAHAEWRLVDDRGRSVRRGALVQGTVETGTLTPLGAVRFDLGEVPAPAHYRFEVTVRDPDLQSTASGNRHASANDWGRLGLSVGHSRDNPRWRDRHAPLG